MDRVRRLPMLFVMVKAPIVGSVKTRLSRGIGSTEALRFYRGATAALVRHLGSDPRWQTVLAITPDRYCRSGFWPSSIACVAQGRGDLGERMQRLLDARRVPTILIGSDIPGIRSNHIAQALETLTRHDVVFGPAKDGGFWLVGARPNPRLPHLFRGVRWSSEHALADTLANLSRPAGFAATLADIDTEADLLRWRRSQSDPLQRESPI